MNLALSRKSSKRDVQIHLGATFLGYNAPKENRMSTRNLTVNALPELSTESIG